MEALFLARLFSNSLADLQLLLLYENHFWTAITRNVPALHCIFLCDLPLLLLLQKLIFYNLKKTWIFSRYIIHHHSEPDSQIVRRYTCIRTIYFHILYINLEHTQGSYTHLCITRLLIHENEYLLQMNVIPEGGFVIV